MNTRRIRLAGFFSLGLLVIGCQRSPDTAAIPARIAKVVLPEDEPAAPIRVRLTAETAPGLYRGAEMTGAVLAQLELGLGDLDGVIPRVQGAPLSPGLSETLEPEVVEWTAQVVVGGDKEALIATMQLCDPARVCRTLSSAPGTLENPTPAATSLLLACTEELERQPLPATPAGWVGPESQDPYAVLLGGRAAAVFYGLLPPLPRRTWATSGGTR